MMPSRWIPSLDALTVASAAETWSADPEVLRPSVPVDQIETLRLVTNPLPATREIVEKGKKFFEGKHFYRACHGAAMALFIPLVFTEETWQGLRYLRSFGQP